MISKPADLPPASHTVRPEKAGQKPGVLDAISRRAATSLSAFFKKRSSRIKKYLKKVDCYGKDFDGLSENELSEKGRGVKASFI